MIYQRISQFLFGLGIVLLLIAGWQYWVYLDSPTESVNLQWEPEQIAVLSPKQTLTVQARLVNRSRVPARIVGLAPC
jgi:hypothetical protein